VITINLLSHDTNLVGRLMELCSDDEYSMMRDARRFARALGLKRYDIEIAVR
jgi:hypothetical protein